MRAFLTFARTARMGYVSKVRRRRLVYEMLRMLETWKDIDDLPVS